MQELTRLCKLASEQGVQAGEIESFEAHLLVLDDPTLLEWVNAAI